MALSSTDILVGVGSGFLAALLGIGAQRAGQWCIDHLVPFPYTVIAKGLEPNIVPASCEARVRIFNRTSMVAKVLPTLLDSEGRPINGMSIRGAWGDGDLLGGWAIIRARGWTAFFVDGPVASDGPLPTSLRLSVHVFTLVKGRQRTFPLAYTYTFR